VGRGLGLAGEEPADKEKLNRFYDSLFGALGLEKQFDELSDSIVLRAHR